jgi:hypothetical protein
MALSVVFVGEEVFHAGLEAGVEEALGRFGGGDGMVTCSSSLSLFGTGERKGQLNGVVIH